LVHLIALVLLLGNDPLSSWCSLLRFPSLLFNLIILDTMKLISSIKVERVWNIVECSKLLIPAMKERKQELTQNTVSD